MALARLNRKAEATLKDNNCVFNAFALGLCEKSLLRQIEKILNTQNKSPDECFKAFITMTASVLDTAANWVSVKEAMLHLRASNVEQFQKVFARILRTLCVDLALLPEEEEFHYQKTIEPFLSAFFCFQNADRFDRSNEDIFLRHDFIKRAFRDATEASILEWWKETGYRKFLGKINKDRVWAGDIEFERLARYFQVVLELVRGEYYCYTVHGNFGRFPALQGDAWANIDEGEKENIKKALYLRDIIRPPLRDVRVDNADELYMPNLQRIYRRLEAVPNFKVAKEWIDKYGESLSKSPVPKEWSSACKDELFQRSVIEYDANKNFRFSVMVLERDRVMAAISAVPCLDAVKEIFKKHYVHRPFMVLCNQSGDHWENTLTLDMPKLNLLPIMGHFSLGQSLQPAMQAAIKKNTSLRRSDEDIVKRKT